MSISEKSKQELQEIARDLHIQGYRKLNKVELVAAILEAQKKSREPEVEKKESFWGKHANHIYGLATIIGLVLAIFSIFQIGSSEENDRTSTEVETLAIPFERQANSIAILPFVDMSAEKNQEYFGDGVAEEIINTLTKLTELKVSGRTSSFSFKGKGLTIEEIGEKLHVKYILTGSIRKAHGNIRISAQLVDAQEGFQLWSERFDRPFDDIFRIQDEMTEKIGSSILGVLNPDQIDRITNNSNIDPEAFALFLEAISIHQYKFYPLKLNKYFVESEGKFKKAIEIEPNYALAYAGLADLYDTKRYILSDSAEMKSYEDLKMDMSQKAIDLNPNLPYVQVARGWVLLDRQIRDIDYVGAFEAFKKAYELDKRNIEGLYGLFWLYERFSLHDDCTSILNKMIEAHPENVRTYQFGSQYYSSIGDYKKAIEMCKAGLDLEEKFALLHSKLAIAAFFEENPAIVMESLAYVKALNPDYFEKNSELNILQAIIQNNIDKANSIDKNSYLLLYHLKEFERLNTFLVADIKNRLRGNLHDQSEYTEYTVHPYFKVLKEDSTFQKLLERHLTNQKKGADLLPRPKSFL